MFGYGLDCMRGNGSGALPLVACRGDKSGIQTRYFCKNDMNVPRDEWTTLPRDWPQTQMGMTKRNETYCSEAPTVAIDACRKAVKMWGGDPSTITHVIAVSCTGVMAPGLETIVMKQLGIPLTAERVGINLMGCFGAFRAISVARAFVDQNPARHRVLAVCCELCSVHFRAEMSFETFIGNAIFADGAAAFVVEALGEGQSSAAMAVEICRSASEIIDSSDSQMTWRASDDGFVFKLSQDIPASLQSAAPRFVQRLVDGDATASDVDYAIHPGGRKIIEDLEVALSLPSNGPRTSCSWSILRDYGNMSSATFLFVLEHKLKHRDETPLCSSYVVGMGFGPGLALEGVLLKVR